MAYYQNRNRGRNNYPRQKNRNNHNNYNNHNNHNKHNSQNQHHLSFGDQLFRVFLGLAVSGGFAAFWWGLSIGSVWLPILGGLAMVAGAAYAIKKFKETMWW